MEPKFSKKIAGTLIEKKLSKSESFGRHLAKRIGDRSAVELCCCLGIQSIQVAKNSNKQVTGVDINKSIIRKAFKNAKIYGVKNVKFIVGDAMDEKLLGSLKSDVVIIDPHWSVTQTLQRDFATKLNETDPPAGKLVRLVRKHITDNIIVEFPWTMPDKEILKLGRCEIQDAFVNGEPKSRIAYFGDLKQKSKSRVKFEFVKGNLPKRYRANRVS